MVLYTGATVEEAIQKGLNDLDIPRMKAHITVVAREKKGFLGLFGKKPAQVEIEPIAETTVVKANQKAVKGVPDEINAQNEPVKTVSEATVDLGRVVAAIKKVEEEGEVVSEEIKTEILKHDKEADTVLEEKGHEHILEKVKEPATKESSESDFSNLGIEVEENYNMFKPWSMKWMWMRLSQVVTTAVRSICKLIPMNQDVSLVTTEKS